jgi:hypothetical protein
MKIKKYIDLRYFFMALVVGLFFAYISTPPPDIVIKYPTPENAGKVVYRDAADVCYKYQSKVVKCPSDRSKIEVPELQSYTDPDIKNNLSVIDTIKSFGSNNN